MYDVIIVGCGLAGLVNALLLAQETDLKIAILDAKAPLAIGSPENHDPRVYAITPATRDLLQKIAAWPIIQAKRLSTFKRMQVWDGQTGAELRFDHASLNVPALGYILEENLIRHALLEKAKACPSIDLRYPYDLQNFVEEEEGIKLDCRHELSATTLRGRLLIGADGAQSWVREKAGITLRLQSYEHSSLIAQVQTEEEHGQTARQVFLSAGDHPPGPLAFLPLSDPHQCSIVWSTQPEEAERLLKMDETEFQEILGQAFAFRLGKMVSVSKRQTFPLYERHVENYVKNRLALIGDAAHTLHPLAGQGINLGIADAAYLTQVIIEALQKDRDFASLSTLRRYERARKGENFIMLSTVKLLKNLFASNNKNLRTLRSQGMKTVNEVSWLKNFFASYAMG